MRILPGIFDTRPLPLHTVVLTAGALLLLAASPYLASAQSAGGNGAGGGAEQVRGFQPLQPEGSGIAPSDGESPESLVSTLYDVISGPADEERDWDRFRALFLPGARLTIARWQTPDGTVEEEARAADVEGFIATVDRSYREAGFWEREIWSRTERFGNVAHVFSTYESRVGTNDSEPVQRGINSFQLVRMEGRWWVTSIAWDVELPGNPIPERYRPD